MQNIIRKEGWSGLYAGLPAGLMGVASTNFAYFFFYSYVRNLYKSKKPGRQSGSVGTLGELLVGAIAGALAQIFTIPVSVIVTRQQTSIKRRTLLTIAHQIVEEEGWYGLWRGLGPSLVLVINPSITYGVFERLKALILETRGKDESKILSSLQVFVLGAMAKTLATVVTYPYIMAKVRLQWKKESNISSSNSSPTSPKSSSSNQYKTAIQILRQVMKKDGILGWYNVSKKFTL